MKPNSEKLSPLVSDESTLEATPTPPAARREPVEHLFHGDRRVDHYDWLRHKESPEVLAYLKAENAYTDAVLKPTEDFQEKLYQEMLGRIQQTDLSVPYRLRGYLYFTRTEEGKQYPYYYRRRVEEGACEELLLDLNQLAEGHSFLGQLEEVIATACRRPFYRHHWADMPWEEVLGLFRAGPVPRAAGGPQAAPTRPPQRDRRLRRRRRRGQLLGYHRSPR